MKPTLNDVSEDTYHPTFHIEPLHEYKDYDSDEDMAYETAFGTTICAGDYMQQYKEHNRAHSNLNSMLVPSPSALKSPARSNNTMIYLMAVFCIFNSCFQDCFYYKSTADNIM